VLKCNSSICLMHGACQRDKHISRMNEKVLDEFRRECSRRFKNDVEVYVVQGVRSHCGDIVFCFLKGLQSH
jgi:hypothetical protein